MDFYLDFYLKRELHYARSSNQSKDPSVELQHFPCFTCAQNPRIVR